MFSLNFEGPTFRCKTFHVKIKAFWSSLKFSSEKVLAKTWEFKILQTFESSKDIGDLWKILIIALVAF